MFSTWTHSQPTSIALAHFHPIISGASQFEVGKSMVRYQPITCPGLLQPVVASENSISRVDQWQSAHGVSLFELAGLGKQIGHVHWHLIDLCRVIKLDVA